jgi:hypothetical protein
MTKGLASGIIVAFVTMSLCLMAARPDWIADSNRFLKDFVNHEFINVLGITLAVTLASAAQIHLAFNRIEEQHKVRNALEKSRARLRSNVYWLITFFAIGVALVTIKPIASLSLTSEAFFNMAALTILLCHVLIMTSLTQLVFAIEPEFFDSDGT